MPETPASLPSARLAVLDGIRRGDPTVNALAARLGVTDNAVRLHLAALERDRHVRRRGVVRSGTAGQPAAEYELTPEGELALSSAYPPALVALVEALSGKLDTRALRAVFMDAGRRLASSEPSRDTGSLATRAGACVALIESLGGRAEVTQSRGHTVLTGAGCPLSAAVRAEPATCTLIEALLEKHAGVKAVQRCDHGDQPRCRFELTVNGH